jgi:TRAP-type C4-dicarboxylate transport system permease small subunit
MQVEMQEQVGAKVESKGKLYSMVTLVSSWMAVIACITLAVMMMFVTVDVTGRDFFNWPLRGTVEIVGLLLILASTWGMGLAQIERRHLRIPLFYDMFPRRVRLWLDILAYVVCFVAAGLVTWQMLMLALKYLRMPVGNTTQILGLPFSPFMVALAWGFGWMCVILLMDIYKTILEVIKK